MFCATCCICHGSTPGWSLIACSPHLLTVQLALFKTGALQFMHLSAVAQ